MTLSEPWLLAGRVTLYCGDSLNVLRSLPNASVDAVVTDPPYSSGGLTRSDRANVAASAKYVVAGTDIQRPEFFGDNRDQRSFGFWCSLWLAEAWRVTKPGGYLMCFTDWRQLPMLSDAIQAGGWVWRGIVAWDKTESAKPQRGWFRHQCEYILTGSHGQMGKEQEREVSVCAPGVFRKAVNAAEKHHITGKPVEVMQSLLQVLPPGAVILDPFAGSGTTLIAARNLGLKSIGIEMSPIVKQRLTQGVLPFNAEALRSRKEDAQ